MSTLDGPMGDNVTETSNTTQSFLCSKEKKPEVTQACGANSEEGTESPAEETTSEVNYK